MVRAYIRWQDGELWLYGLKERGLYFTQWEFIGYRNLRQSMNYLYNCLDVIYYMVDDALSI